MTYPILDPARRDESLRHKCALAVMAKAPRPGKVKTRLSPPLTATQAAELNICFLRDTTRNIAAIAASGSASGVISYTPVGDEALFDGLLPDGFALVPQRGDGFGERLLYAAEDLLACGFGSVCLIDSDSPTLPAASLRQAVESLGAPGDRIVLGGSEDGGYYLIGMKAPHSEPFQRITWSTASVLAETVERVNSINIELIQLPQWYDVDDDASLQMLRQEVLFGKAPAFSSGRGYEALATTEYLRMLDRPAVPGGKA